VFKKNLYGRFIYASAPILRYPATTISTHPVAQSFPRVQCVIFQYSRQVGAGIHHQGDLSDVRAWPVALVVSGNSVIRVQLVLCFSHLHAWLHELRYSLLIWIYVTFFSDKEIYVTCKL
jgi:hypothetical protein